MAIARVYLIAVSSHLDGYNCRFFYNLLRIVFVTRISPLSMIQRDTANAYEVSPASEMISSPSLSYREISISVCHPPCACLHVIRESQGNPSSSRTKIDRIEENAVPSLARVSI